MAQNSATAVLPSVRSARRSPAQEGEIQVVSFISYLPAFLVAVLQDFLDFVFLIIAALPIPGSAGVALVLSFVFDIGLGALTFALLFFFTSSNASFMKRWMRFFFPEVANIIPIVSILPMACLSVWLVYQLDKSAATITKKTVGRLAA